VVQARFVVTLWKLLKIEMLEGLIIKGENVVPFVLITQRS